MTKLGNSQEAEEVELTVPEAFVNEKREGKMLLLN